MTGFSAELRQRADAIWEAQHEHPLVRGIGDGSLDPETFAFWLRQDYLYLIDYARLFAMAVVRAPDLAAMTAFSRVLHGILETEMNLHRSYCEGFGMSAADLEGESRAPMTEAYTNFLLRVATTGDYAELLGALLPCMWGFHEIGVRLQERGMPEEPRYREWIQMYAGEEFGELARWCIDLLDRACDGLGDEGRERVAAAFITSSRYELAFWEMAWTREEWVV